MYSWGDDMSDWHRPGAYKYDAASKAARDAEARRAAASGPRTYSNKGQPDVQRVDPKKKITTNSKNPLLVMVDVTGSMQTWPAEIFDRLPLLYQTLSQYRPDLEVSFAAIGDSVADRWPLQVTQFAKGYDLETQLKALFGEGGGGDIPESYGLYAWYAMNQITTPNAEKPFMICFGDATMHPKVHGGEIEGIIGVEGSQDHDAFALWQQVAQRYNCWFLRRPSGKRGDEVEKCWNRAVGAQQVVWIDDEQRAVDYAMGLIARSWGHFDNFKSNMRARHDDGKVKALEKKIAEIGPRVLACPKCTGKVPPGAKGRFTCTFCGTTLELD